MIDRKRFGVTKTAGAVARELGGRLDGPDGELSRFSAFPPDAGGSLCFLQGRAPDPVPGPSGFSAVVADEDAVRALRAAGYTVIVSAHPKYDCARAVRALKGFALQPGIHPTAILDGDVAVDPSASVGAHAVLMGRVQVGAGTIIRSGAVIGDDPFTFGVGPDGKTERLPCVGGVVIGRGVDIGHHVVISRAVDGDTIVSDGAKVNDLTNLGNAVFVGENAVIMANCALGGRVRVGRGCWIGLGASIRDSVTLGDDAQVGMGAVVIEDVAPGTIVAGVPAKFLRMRR